MIPFFDYKRAYLDEKDQILKTIDNVASKGGFIMQTELNNFEKNLSKYVNSKFAIGVANATDALELAWSNFNLKQGDEVIISSHTMLATASAIKLAGGTPVPVDILDDGLIDPYSVEKAITSKTVGISPTHLNGRTCDMEKIMSIAKENSLVVVEDAAQALGSKFKGKNAGTFGYASCISFYPAKVLGCLGDGGALLVQDESLYDVFYQLHDHGRNDAGEAVIWGRNSRLDNIQAAILDFRLKEYSKVVKRRREIANIYQSRLEDIPEIILPPKPEENSVNFDVFQNYEIQTERRDELKIYLSENNIGSLIQWGGKAVHQCKNLGFDQVLPKTENYFKKCIMIPMNIFISDDNVHFISDTIQRFFKS